MSREALLVAHTGYEDNMRTAEQVARQLAAAGVSLRVLAEEAEGLGPAFPITVVDAGPRAADGAEIVLVLGGDGTLLRGAEMARRRPR